MAHEFLLDADWGSRFVQKGSIRVPEDVPTDSFVVEHLETGKRILQYGSSCRHRSSTQSPGKCEFPELPDWCLESVLIVQINLE
jgi:hypothetical protein